MLDADAQDLDLHIEAAKEFSKTQIQAVCQVDPKDQSISAAMRGQELTLSELEINLRELLGLSHSSGKQEFMLAAAWIQSELASLVRSLPDGEIKQCLSKPELTMKDLLQVLEHCPSQQRLAFAEELLMGHSHDEQVQSFLKDKLDNTLHYFSSTEKEQLIDTLLKNESIDRGDKVASVLTSCGSLSELCTIVDGIGAEQLMRLNDPHLDELLAHALVTSQVREVAFPKIGQGTSLEKGLDALLAAYEQVHRVASENPRLAHTQVVKDILHTVSDGLQELETDLQALENQLDDTSVLADLLERYCRAGELEFRYGVNLSRGVSSYLSEDDDAEVCRAEEFGVNMLAPTAIDKVPLESSGQWSVQDLKHVAIVLGALPESDLLFTPRLREIERVPSLGYGVLGVRYHHGLIQIADSSIDHDGIRKNYDGVDSLVIVLTHEIGHGIQLGDGFGGIHYHGDGESTFGEGEEAIDFDEWSELSDWTTYHRGRFEPGDSYGTIKLDGEQYPLNKPTMLGGKEVVLLHDPSWDVLISYRADADFSNRWYSRTNPWEDFAEAFSEYFFLPERLIADAPQKFKHMEEEFKRYKNDPKIKELLEQALRQNR